jgi:hypothetical protein
MSSSGLDSVRGNLGINHKNGGVGQKQTEQLWRVVAEWLGRRTLNQRVVGSNPGEGTARYL